MGRFMYAEYAIGGVQNRNNVARIDEFLLAGTRSECYRSLFLFDEGLKVWVDRTGSVKGYADKHTAEEMVFDFDGEVLEAVQKEVVNFCQYLIADMEVPQEVVRIAFSGCKGFHVSLPMQSFGQIEPSVRFSEGYKSAALALAADFKSTDQAIYEPRRLMRMLNTINVKSGLFKIPLTLPELESLTIDQIKELAKAERQVEQLPSEEIGEVPALRGLWTQFAGAHPNVAPSAAPAEREIGLGILAGVSSGERNSKAMSIAGLFISKGFDEAFTLGLVRLWNSCNTPPMDDEEVSRVVRGAYQQYWKPKEELKVYNLTQAQEVYQDYASNTGARVLLGYPVIDSKIRGIRPGETCCIVGKASVGKSAFLQNVGLNHAKRSGLPVLFFSMEMPITSVFERTIQVETGMAGGEVEAAYAEGKKKELARFNLALTTYPTFYMVEKSGLTLSMIKEFIRFAEESVYHTKTSLVLIDYLGLVKGEGDGIYEQVSTVARGMKDLAKECHVPVIFLSQANRKYEDTDELGIGAARDSGAVDEASDFLLGLSLDCGPKDGPAKGLVLNIAKNRRGGIGRTALLMDKKSVRITEALIRERACDLKPRRSRPVSAPETE